MRGFFSTGVWGIVAAVVMVAWIGVSHFTADRAPGRVAFRAIYGASAAEQDQLGALLGEAYGVLRSDAFRANLLRLRDRYPVIYAKRDDQEADVDKLARIVAVEGPIARYAPAGVTLVGGDRDGDPTRDLAEAGEGEGLGRYAQITLGRGVLDQFRSPDIVARSCAVNVAAHEYAHTISTVLFGFGIAFTDTNDAAPQIRDRRHPGTPVASYLIGAVAQCTWLQLKGRITEADVPACVETFGVSAFNWKRCGQFAAGEPVALRPGLAEAAPSL